MLGYADAADRSAGTQDRERGLDGFVEADALEHRVRTVLRQLAEALDRFLAMSVDVSYSRCSSRNRGTCSTSRS